MAWFNYLKENGFLDPSKNPASVSTENGDEIPFWGVLDYVEKLAETFSNSENMEFIPDVLDFIKNVSEKPVDNYKTFSRIIRILSLIPNKYVTAEYLSFIPVWLDSRYDTMLQTHELFNSLLPKFLSDNSSLEDIGKAEIILTHSFKLKKNRSNLLGDGYSIYTYDSPLYLYYVNHYFNDEKQIKITAEKCGNVPFYALLNSVNILIRDTPITGKETVGDIAYSFLITRNFENLTITVNKIENEVQIEIINQVIDNYLDKGPVEQWLDKFLRDIFKEQEIRESLYERILEKIVFNLNNDLISIFGYDGIKDLDDEVRNSSKTVTVFSLLLRNWLVEMSNKPDLASINEVFRDLIENHRYNIPFFKRMILYVVAENWENLKFWFWYLIDEDDPLQIFTEGAYKLELYHLLYKIAKKLTDIEVQKLQFVLDKGPQEQKYYTPEKEIWQHRWLDALKENDIFAKQFHEITVKNNMKTDYSNEGKITVRVGNISPFTADEILSMPPETLIEQILGFDSTNRWEGPSIDGFADEIKIAVKSNPDYFTLILADLNDAGYIYINNILYGLTDAWKSGNNFDWHKVLEFCMNYITSDNFIHNRIKNNDEIKTAKDWVYDSIAYLIIAGIQNDNQSIDTNLFPAVKDILLYMINICEEEQTDWDYETDFVLYSINTSRGKLFRALLEYSLKTARTCAANDNEIKWETDIKSIFTTSLVENSTEAYTLLGMYFRQFMYLDNSWLLENVSSINVCEDKSWLAFIKGLAYSNAVSKEYYIVIRPIYEKVIENNAFDKKTAKGLMRHLFAYYLWDYDSAKETSLLYELLNSDINADLLNQIIAVLVQNRKALMEENRYSEDEISLKIFPLWEILAEKIKRITDRKSLDLLQNIIYLNDYVEELNSENFSLVYSNFELFSDVRSNIYNVKNLVQWSKNSPADLVGKISQMLNFEYVHNQNLITELTEYLYSNDQKAAANNLVNNFAMNGFDFLRDLFQKYN